MSDLVDFYQHQVKSQRSPIPWLADIQQNASADFTRLGFPQKFNEEWKYTAVNTFLQQQFSTDLDTKGTTPPKLTNVPPVGHPIAIMNGQVIGIDELVTHLPSGAVVQPMATAVIEHSDKIKPYLNNILQHQHGFQALNTAMLNNGLFIYLPKNACLTTPLLLLHCQDKANSAMYVRHLVVLEAGSSACIIEDYQGDEQCSYFTNTITEISLAANAQLTHYKIQRESKLAYHIGHVAVKQSAGSQFDSHSFSTGGRLVRSDLNIELCEPKARCLMNGVYIPNDKQHIVHHTLVTHQAPHCSSEQDYKGILNGHARAVFNGRIIVAQNAQRTEARQQNKNLLLSKNTEIDTKPQLEIFADDVLCTHGATVGQLDEEALFYLATRGIERSEATRYLVQAFAVENMRAIKDVELEKWICNLLWIK